MTLAAPGSLGLLQPHHARIGVCLCGGVTSALGKVALSALEEEQVLRGPAKRAEKARLPCPSLPQCTQPCHLRKEGEAGKTGPVRAEVTPNRRQTFALPRFIWRHQIFC